MSVGDAVGDDVASVGIGGVAVASTVSLGDGEGDAWTTVESVGEGTGLGSVGEGTGMGSVGEGTGMGSVDGLVCAVASVLAEALGDGLGEGEVSANAIDD